MLVRFLPLWRGTLCLAALCTGPLSKAQRRKKHVKPLDAHRLWDQWSLIMPRDPTDVLGIQSLESNFQFSPEPSPNSAWQSSVTGVVLCVMREDALYCELGCHTDRCAGKRVLLSKSGSQKPRKLKLAET